MTFKVGDAIEVVSGGTYGEPAVRAGVVVAILGSKEAKEPVIVSHESFNCRFENGPIYQAFKSDGKHERHGSYVFIRHPVEFLYANVYGNACSAGPPRAAAPRWLNESENTFSRTPAAIGRLVGERSGDTVINVRYEAF